VFSVSPAEILTIALVALVVFGPKRLPEISRKAGKVLREIKETAGELKQGLEAEYDDPIGALGDVRREMRSTLDAVGGLVQPEGPRKPRIRPALRREQPAGEPGGPADPPTAE
jgi:Tat protein translocase TatB subunit